jgi:MYXO-CTERM domain-containing protein
MSNGAVAADGTVRAGQAADVVPVAGTNTVSGSGALVIVLDVQDPARLRTLATLPVPGEIADSRVVGNVLYLATYENAGCYRCGPAPRTMVTSFDIATLTAIRQVEQVSFQSNAPDGYNLPWGSNWKRSIFVTDQRLYVGGHADIDPQSYGTAKEGIIDVLDVTDPQGRLGVGARLVVAGAILSRWQLDERDGVLRVVSQQGAGRTGNGIGAPQVDTFRVESARSFTPLGHMTMELPRQEGLRTVRFDGSRAYAITYNQTDPLFVIDLADPGNPVQRGELYMPGFMFHLEPHGDRVIGLGIDRTDREGSLNVSLFDVSDPNLPRMIKRVAFGTPGITEDYEILNSEISEDQDRIQKSFRVFPDGLVVAPFTALRTYTSQGSGCDNAGGGVQLVEWTADTLSKRALLPLPGNPRRAFENNEEMIAVSDSNVRSFSLARLDTAHQTADVVIGTCTPKSTPLPSYGGGPGPGFEGGGDYPRACSAAPGRGGSDWWPVFLALAALALPRLIRRRVPSPLPRT